MAHRPERKVKTLLPKRISRFVIVGIAGFLVDAGLTATFIHSGLDPFTARLIAISTAMLVTWRLNRAITFGRSATSQQAEGLRYSMVAILAAIINYASYAVLVLVFPGIFPVLAVALATGTSMCFSYLGYSRYAFKAA